MAKYDVKLSGFSEDGKSRTVHDEIIETDDVCVSNTWVEMFDKDKKTIACYRSDTVLAVRMVKN